MGVLSFLGNCCSTRCASRLAGDIGCVTSAFWEFRPATSLLCGDLILIWFSAFLYLICTLKSSFLSRLGVLLCANPPTREPWELVLGSLRSMLPLLKKRTFLLRVADWAICPGRPCALVDLDWPLESEKPTGPSATREFEARIEMMFCPDRSPDDPSLYSLLSLVHDLCCSTWPLEFSCRCWLDSTIPLGCMSCEGFSSYRERPGGG